MDYHRIKLSNTNCYLIKASDGYLLIDCGNTYDGDALEAALHKLGLTAASIQYLLLTHHHSDHCGLLHFLLSANPDLIVIMSKQCAGYLRAGKNYTHSSEQYASPALHSFFAMFNRLSTKLSFSFPPYAARPSDILIEGDVSLPVPGIEGVILNTPGHTLDSISLIIGEDAFVGDAVRNILNLLGAAYEPILIYDRSTCHASWNKLLACNVKSIHPAHGKCIPIKHILSKNHPYG